jgi:uncharacterized protein DUF998
MGFAFVLALLSFLASLYYFGVFIALHFLPTGYSPVHNAVSDYARSKYAEFYRWGLWSSSAGVLLLALGLAVGVGAPPLVARGIVYLVLVVVSRIALSLFPTDIEGQKLTRTGRLHYLFAVLTFAFTYAAMSVLTPTLVTIHPWTAVRDVLVWLVDIAEAALVLVVVTLLPALRRYFGLCERLFLVSTNVWILLVALLLMEHS